MSSRTSALADLRFGVQVPRISKVPPYDYSTGAEVIDLAASAGLMLDPWQKWFLERVNGRTNDTDEFAAFEAALVVARQNGKSGPIHAQLLDDLFVSKNRLTVYSAHDMKGAKKVFFELLAIIDGSDQLRRRAKKPTFGNDNVGIMTLDGAELRVFARSRSSGRAFTGDKLYFDEAFKLGADQIAAMIPTLAARWNQQIWYISSAPLLDSSQLRSLIKRGRHTSDADVDGLLYAEWSCPADVDLSDRQAWAMANPGMGYRVTERYIAKEKRAFGTDMIGWARERLTIFEEEQSGGVFAESKWVDLADAPVLDEDGIPVPGSGSQMAAQERPVFGIAVDIDRTVAAVGTAGLREDGPMHLELVDHRPGTDWLVDRCVDLHDAWEGATFVVDKGSPAGTFIPDLIREDLDVHVLDAPQYTAACARMVDNFEADAIAHRAQQALTSAAIGAGKRTIGDGFGFSRRLGVDITPLEAVTVAAYWQLVGVDPDYDPADSVH